MYDANGTTPSRFGDQKTELTVASDSWKHGKRQAHLEVGVVQVMHAGQSLSGSCAACTEQRTLLILAPLAVGCLMQEHTHECAGSSC